MSENIHEYSITRGLAGPKKGDRMLVGKKIFLPAAISKKGRTRWQIFHPRVIHFFVWIRSHKFASDDRSVAKREARESTQESGENLALGSLARLENGGVAAASARGLSPDVLGVHIVAVVGGGCPRLLLQEHRHRPALVRSLIVDGVE